MFFSPSIYATTEYEMKRKESLAQAAITYLNKYIKDNCQGMGIDFNIKWQEKANYYLKSHDRSEHSVASLIDTLSKYISTPSICRHISKISVFAQASEESIEKNKKIYEAAAEDGKSYLSLEQIKLRLSRSLTGFTETHIDMINKKIQNLKDMDDELGSETLRRNVMNGLGSLSTIDKKEIEELRTYLVTKKLVTEEQFEERLQRGFSAFGRKDLVYLVDSVVSSLENMGLNYVEIGQMYLDNPEPFLTTKDQDIQFFYNTYLTLLRKSDVESQALSDEPSRRKQVVEYIKEKLYVMPGLNTKTLRGFLDVANTQEFRLSETEKLNLFHSVVLDISHNRIDWLRVINNLRMLLLLKDEQGQRFLSEKQILLLIRKHIRSLATQELTNVLQAGKLSHREKYGKCLGVLAESVVKDPDQLSLLKELLSTYVRFSKNEFQQFLVKHYRVFMNNEESVVVDKVLPIIYILNHHLSNEKLKEVLLKSFGQLLTVKNIEDFELVVDAIANLLKAEVDANKQKFSVGEVLVLLINGGELINLELDRVDLHVAQAQEMLSWGFSLKEAIVHTFQAENQQGSLAKMSLSDLIQRRLIFEKVKMRSLDTFLRRNEDTILSTSIEDLDKGVEQAKKLGVSGADLERWMQLGFFKYKNISLDLYKNLDRVFDTAIKNKKVTYQQIYLLVEMGQKDQHEWKFPHGLISGLIFILERVEARDLYWLMPHLYAVFSQRGLEIVKYINNSPYRAGLLSENLAKLLYLGITDQKSDLGEEFLLRAVAMTTPRPPLACGEALGR